MNVLIACEESQEVCKAFRAKGHMAFSCDILECSGGHPEWHIQCNVETVLKDNYHVDGWFTGIVIRTMDGVNHFITKWDMIIAHPPCTDLAISGARWFKEKQADGRQQASIEFFMKFTDLDCPKVVIENPVCIMSSIYRKPDQIIHPYMFGDPVRKKTCLWLKGVPKLLPTNIVEPNIIKDGNTSYSGPAYYAKDENGKIIPWNDPRTAKIRSRTYPGIAKAMAEQWGGNYG